MDEEWLPSVPTVRCGRAVVGQPDFVEIEDFFVDLMADFSREREEARGGRVRGGSGGVGRSDGASLCLSLSAGNSLGY